MASRLQAWFPRRLDDPDIALNRVDMDKAEYWESPSDTMMYLFGFVKAIVTDKPLEYAGENRKLEI